jgi:glycine C-acetyltransferase
MDWLPGTLAKALDPIYPKIRSISGSSTDPEIIADGRRVLLFCSPNYLGLSNHPDMRQAAKEAIDLYGVGTNGSGIISGYTDLHQQLEEKLADFMQTESVAFFNSVTQTSMGVITTVVIPPLLPLFRSFLSTDDLGDSAIFFDEQNHASLFDAIKLARPDKTYLYHHCDADHLETLLKNSNHRRKLIITDGYFSMSARLAPLQDIVRLANEYNAMILVDDAHGTGVLGENGRGTAEYFGAERDIHFQIGSTSKALGVRGGFVGGTAQFTKYLKFSARGYVFSGTLPAHMPASLIKAVEILKHEPWRRKKVLENAEYLRSRLTSMGYTVLGEKHIVPVLIGDENQADALSLCLDRQGIFASSIRYPAVPKGQALIRFMPMATHTQEHLDTLLEACRVML